VAPAGLTDEWAVRPWDPRAAVPKLAAGETHVWLLELDVSDADAARLGALLSPDEASRAEAFHRELHRRRYVAGRGRLREILAAYAEVDPRLLRLDEGPNGKPELARADVRFNLAHSEGLGVCAVSRAEVGVDIEVVGRSRRPRWRQVAERFFHEQELAGLRGLATEPGWIEFLRVWTLKEACLKATGLGLLTDPRSFSVASVPAGGASAVVLGGREWLARELSTPRGAVAALATSSASSV
jgi:4'-phosphopantetheinyl transferase